MADGEFGFRPLLIIMGGIAAVVLLLWLGLKASGSEEPAMAKPLEPSYARYVRAPEPSESPPPAAPPTPPPRPAAEPEGEKLDWTPTQKAKHLREYLATKMTNDIAADNNSGMAFSTRGDESTTLVVTIKGCSKKVLEALYELAVNGGANFKQFGFKQITCSGSYVSIPIQ